MADAERFYRIGLATRARSIALRAWHRSDGSVYDPMDLVQTCLLKAWEVYVANEGLSDERLQRLVAVSCRNRARDHQRRQGRRRRFHADESADDVLRRLGLLGDFEDDSEDE